MLTATPAAVAAITDEQASKFTQDIGFPAEKTDPDKRNDKANDTGLANGVTQQQPGVEVHPAFIANPNHLQGSEDRDLPHHKTQAENDEAAAKALQNEPTLQARPTSSPAQTIIPSAAPTLTR